MMYQDGGWCVCAIWRPGAACTDGLWHGPVSQVRAVGYSVESVQWLRDDGGTVGRALQQLRD